MENGVQAFMVISGGVAKFMCSNSLITHEQPMKTPYLFSTKYYRLPIGYS